MPESKSPNNRMNLVLLAGLAVIGATGIAIAVLFFTDPAPQTTPMLQAQQAFIAGEYTRAVSYFSDVLHDNPDDYEALVGRGIAYSRLDDLTTAQRDLLAAAALPEAEIDTRALYYLGEIAFREGRGDDALQRYSAALAVAESQGRVLDSAYYRRGQVYAQQGAYDDALREYEQAIAANNTEADYFRAQGDAFYAIGFNQQALNSYQAYLSLSSDGGDRQIQARIDELRGEE